MQKDWKVAIRNATDDELDRAIARATEHKEWRLLVVCLVEYSLRHQMRLFDDTAYITTEARLARGEAISEEKS